ncbi:MAG: hypothetical protein NTY97_05530 [Planctomycetota bacterium]|nr:hypothetical protein [Planctomycetota bacterium]
MLQSSILSKVLLGTSTFLLASTAVAQVTQSSTSSATPYVRPVAGGVVVSVVSFLTVGDSVNFLADGVTPYRMAGIPDGMGAYDNGDGTMTLFVNHEHTTTANGINHAHQPAGTVGGAFASRWIVKTTPGTDFLRVTNGQDLMTSISMSTVGGGTLTNFNRFCSADLAQQSAFYNAATGLGTTERIFITGEESGSNGRMVAIGAVERKGYELPAFTPLQGGWETGVARPYASDKTLVMGNSDGGANRVFMYLGTKLATGNVAEKAGLLNGVGYGMQVQVDSVNFSTENRTLCFATSGAPRYSATFTFAAAGTAAGTTFLRPEDGAWDPSNPADYYFVTTDRVDNIEDGGTQGANSRLFRLHFSDVNNPLAGGTIDALLDGTDIMNMGDNLCVFNDIQGGTRVIIQEDPGNSTHNAKTLLYTVATDTLEIILESDRARFGDIQGVAAVAPFNVDEENSGVIDARDTLGLGWFIADMQAHYTITGELVEGGQIYAFYAPAAVGSCGLDVAQPLNGQIDGEDLVKLLSQWNLSGSGDVSRDGIVGGRDLAELLGGWGPCN